MSATMESLSIPRARHGVDTPLCIAVLCLLSWGLIMVASASVAQAEKLSGDPFHYFYRQLLFIGIGGGLGFFMYCLPMRLWERSSTWIYATALLVLVLVLVPGIGLKVNAARRWIDLGLFRLQASEPARLAVIIYVAGYIARRQLSLQESFKGLLMPLLAVLVPSVLLLAEPDFGATAILFGVVFLMLFLGGARVHYYLALLGAAAAALAVIAIAEPYRVKRLLNFMNPWADVENAGWQLAQSLIAVGRGEWFGVGLGNSVQKLLYLPEMHTDFIFAILAEEFGLFGIAVLMSLFAVVVWRGFLIARRAELDGRLFQAYLCYGLTGWLGLQALINMSVNMGLLPTKGLTLPLMSYGGSSLLTVCAMLGLILRIDHENRAAAFGHTSAEDRRR